MGAPLRASAAGRSKLGTQNPPMKRVRRTARSSAADPAVAGLPAIPPAAGSPPEGWSQPLGPGAADHLR